MAEIEIILPTVQYGNVKITATPEEWGLADIADAPDVGVWAATYLNLFRQGFEHGAKMDVSAHLGAAQAAPEVQAQRLLNEGLGGVTEVPAGDAVAHLPNDEITPPWEQPQPEVKKPWENSDW
jgi:hypothetical protein